MAEVRWVVEIVCGFQWRVFVGWLCICVCVCLRVGAYMCGWVVPGVCVGGGGSLGGSVLHMGLAHGICFSFRALRLPHEFQI